MKERILLLLPAVLVCAWMVSCNASATSGLKQKDSAAIVLTTSTGIAIQDPVETGIEVGEATMAPGRNLVDNISRSKDHTTFTLLLKASGLIASLTGTDAYTLFVPTNEAFNDMPPGAVDTLLQPAHKEELKQLIRRHLITGNFTLDQLHHHDHLRTLSGIPVSLHRKGGHWWINQARIVTADIESSNGTMFVTEAVLQP